MTEPLVPGPRPLSCEAPLILWFDRFRNGFEVASPKPFASARRSGTRLVVTARRPLSFPHLSAQQPRPGEHAVHHEDASHATDPRGDR